MLPFSPLPNIWLRRAVPPYEHEWFAVACKNATEDCSAGCMFAGSDGLQLARKEDQLDLLAQVLAAGAEDAAEEADDDTDGVAQRPAARRVVGNLASMSGAACPPQHARCKPLANIRPLCSTACWAKRVV